MDADRVIRDQLLDLLRGGNAHMSFDDAVSGFPLEAVNTHVPHSSYMVWHLLVHMRIVQWDILEFVRNPNHISPDFPAGYWPRSDETGTPEIWEQTVRDIRKDLKDLEGIVQDPNVDFFGPIPHAKKYTIFREILLVADHNAFHVGELVAVRRVLNLNPVKEY